LASLRAVDRGVGRIWRTLREQRLRRDTVVVFTSDNGYAYGEHRIVLEKQYPYEEALRVPLTVRLPSRLAPDGQPRVSGAPVANVDLAPTVLELAGAEPCKRGGCRVLDGRSLLGETSGASDIPRDRAITLGYSAGQPNKGLVCEYQGVRTTSITYVSHLRARESLAAGCDQPVTDREHYDRSADPFQLANLFPAAPGTALAVEQSQPAARLRRLSSCRGIEGRDHPSARRGFCE
jgi:arylsulfatase A-like enzyme